MSTPSINSNYVNIQQQKIQPQNQVNSNVLMPPDIPEQVSVMPAVPKDTFQKTSLDANDIKKKHILVWTAIGVGLTGFITAAVLFIKSKLSSVKK